MLTPSDVGIRVQRTSITGARVWLATNGNRIAHRGSTSPQQAFLSRAVIRMPDTSGTSQEPYPMPQRDTDHGHVRGDIPRSGGVTS